MPISQEGLPFRLTGYEHMSTKALLAMPLKQQLPRQLSTRLPWGTDRGMPC